ncbi:MAG TPA: universal stress protein [Labilithrix sp.]|jgi:nucleotide-binding universal stress UspA family protein|nr:universal stress protein [Labilithrix sp.]
MVPIKNILVPIDFGEPSDSALGHAIDLAEALDAKVYVLNVYELPLVGFPDGAVIPTAEIASRIVNASQKVLDEAVAKHRGRKVAVSALLKQGDARDVILSVAKEVGAGLIVMGTHGRSGIARALIGSVAERIVRTSSIPVLTVHAEGPRAK